MRKKSQAAQLRLRLFERFLFRRRQQSMLKKIRKKIQKIEYEDKPSFDRMVSAIVLFCCDDYEDHLIVNSLLCDKDLMHLCPAASYSEEALQKTRLIIRVLPLPDTKSKALRFYKELLFALRDVNRTLVVGCDGSNLERSDDLGVKRLVKISMLSSTPFLPISLEWDAARKHCSIVVKKKVFISPRSSEFKDVFFSRRGARKFSQLTDEQTVQIANRVKSLIERKRT